MTAFGVAMDTCLDNCLDSFQGDSQSDDCVTNCRKELVEYIPSVNFTGITVST